MRLIGLEPTRPKTPDPKSDASTNSATSAGFRTAKVAPFSQTAKCLAGHVRKKAPALQRWRSAGVVFGLFPVTGSMLSKPILTVNQLALPVLSFVRCTAERGAMLFAKVHKILGMFRAFNTLLCLWPFVDTPLTRCGGSRGVRLSIAAFVFKTVIFFVSLSKCLRF